jgi:hypothetical protein
MILQDLGVNPVHSGLGGQGNAAALGIESVSIFLSPNG